MKLTDTHSHLYDTAFDADREEASGPRRGGGREHLLLPGIDSESHGALFDLCRRHPGQCVLMMGLHPTSVNDNPHWREELALAERYHGPARGHRTFLRRGRDRAGLLLERRVRRRTGRGFRFAMPPGRTARPSGGDPHPCGMGRHVPDHRGGSDGRGGGRAEAAGVFHAFSEDAVTYRKLKACGDFAFGIGGVVTFRKSKLADTVREMELDDIVLETDCPYLTPAPHRGERNESAYVRFVCEKVAELKGLPPAKWRPQRRRTPNVFSEYNTIRPYDEIFDPDHLYGRYHRHEERCRNRRPGAFRLQRHLR